MAITRIGVVGGGIIGLAVAREFTQRYPDSTVTVFEKEPQLAAHQSGHNSGVVHAGLYYEPGSLKAKLCRRGVELLAAYCRDKDLPYEECGKLLVAHTTEDVDRLESIFGRARANGVPEVRMLDRKEMVAVEPEVRGVLALHSPRTAITDYAAITQSFGDEVFAAGGRLAFGAEVSQLSTVGREVRVRTALPGVESKVTEDAGAFDIVVTCAGLQSDRLAVAAGLSPEPRIVPFQGDYFYLERSRAGLVKGLIYPVPDPAYPFLGVHLSRTVHGDVLLGPNAFLALGRERYDKFGVNLGDIGSTLGFKGFWKFASQNVKAAIGQGRTALSRSAFVEQARAFVPAIRPEDVSEGPRGIRAQAMNADGSLVDDFVFSTRGRLTMVRNAPSPGATASMAIAEHVVAEATRDA